MRIAETVTFGAEGWTGPRICGGIHPKNHQDLEEPGWFEKKHF